ncbi:hypothetical protein ACFWRU_25665, partial [Streptomyces californicus]|uniref:hypothetical protein n=2 Tax=Streptomyces californicus TaxID=67351 RepID=UPI0036640D07
RVRFPVEAGPAILRSYSFRFPGLRFRVFPFRRLQRYQTLFRSVSGPNSISGGLWSGLAFRLIRLYQKLLGLKELPGEDSTKGKSCGSAEWR